MCAGVPKSFSVVGLGGGKKPPTESSECRCPFVIAPDQGNLEDVQGYCRGDLAAEIRQGMDCAPNKKGARAAVRRRPNYFPGPADWVGAKIPPNRE